MPNPSSESIDPNQSKELSVFDNIVSQIKDFGNDDAEQESTNDYLIQHFVRTEAYQKALEGTKTIFLGRKGAGKSAIFLFLEHVQTKDDGISLAFVVPDDISSGKLREFVGKSLTEQASKTLIWKYILLVMIARFIVDTANHGWLDEKTWPDDAKKIRKFLVDNDEIEDLRTVERMAKLATKLQAGNITIKISALGEIGIKRQDKEESSLLLESIDRIEKLISGILKTTLFRERRLHIYVDQVDEIWTNDQASNQLVIGLLEAGREINVKFKGVRCIIFLRTDIYQILEFHDKDKYHGSELEIHWSGRELVNLIYERVRKFVDVSRYDFEDQIFDGTINDIGPLDYMIDRTLLRPRDLIQFCNISLDLAKQNKHWKIKAKDIELSEETYSIWKTGDLIGEYRTSYPFLNDLLIVFAKHLGFDVPVFSREHFTDKYSAVKSKLERKNSSLSDLTVEVILNILYNISFLGLVRGENVIYKHLNHNTINDLDDQFIIHPAFRKSLGVDINVGGSTETSIEDTELAMQKEDSQIKQEGDDVIPLNPLSDRVADASQEPSLPQFVAGVNEVVIKGKMSDFAILERQISKMKRIPSVETGRVVVAKVNAYLSEAMAILGRVDEDISDIIANTGEEYFYLPRYTAPAKNLTRCCRLIEEAINRLETIDAGSKPQVMYHVRFLTNILEKLYSILVVC